MKRYTALIYVGLFFCCWMIALIYLYQKGKPPGRLIYGEIPEQTKKHLGDLANTMDVSVCYNPQLRPQDWQDRLNYGEDPKTGLEKIEDENFIVYFDDSDEWAARAQTTLQIANEAIPELILLMGWYHFPADVNNRKLPIYLAKDKNQYIRLANSVAGTKLIGANDTSAGIYISQYSRMGNLTLGIVLHSPIWDSQDMARRVIWHEMNHYECFTSLEYDNVVSPYTWVCEGLAEYFSRTGNRISWEQAMQYMGYSLSRTFPDVTANCGGGESVYRFMEQNYGKEKLCRFVRATYNNTVEQSLSDVFDSDFNHFESQWKHYLAGFTVKKYIRLE